VPNSKPQAEGVAAGFGVAPDQPVLVENSEQPVDGALVQRQPLCYVAGAELMRVFRQDLQDVDRALEHLHAIGGTFR
jgi:hypothetical protein